MGEQELYRETMGKIIRTARLHRRVIEGEMQELGIHHSQHAILMFLSRQEATPSQREIAMRFDISPAAVAGTIKKLEQGGYIEKKVAREDGRSYEIGLSHKGRAVVDRSKALFQRVDDQIFQGLSKEELEQMQQLLDRVQNNLKQLECRKDELV